MTKVTTRTKAIKRPNDQVRVNGEIKQRLKLYVVINGGTISGAAIELLDGVLPKLPKSSKK